MKYIITEEQLSLLRESKIGERVQKAIFNLYNKNLSFQDISRIVGVDLETVILTLQDEEIFDENDCNKMYNILYNVLWGTNLILREYEYNDKSVLERYFDNFSGTIEFEYRDPKSNKLFGFATFLWDAECRLPLDISTYQPPNEQENYNVEEYYGDINFKENGNFENIRTLRDLIDFINEDYFKILKPILASTIMDYKDHV
jgi:hypothetical protein